jgi:uncharacterized membrane protein (UPF0127 family)
MKMKLMRIESTDAQRIPVEFCEAEIADGVFSRFLGLQFRKSLPPGSGLLLVPCRNIHTHWLRFAIDVVRIDSAGCVIAVEPHVDPWRISKGARETYAILELPGATAQIHPGDWLRIADPAAAPRSLKFLTGPVPLPKPTDKPAPPEQSAKSSKSPRSTRNPASEGNDAGSVDDVSQKVIHV